MPRNVLTAVAWPYANGPRHIGHVAGFGVPSDVFSRYQRMAGNSGAHGQRDGRARHADPGAGRPRGRDGARAGRPLQPGHRDDLQGLGLSYDLFTRTTTRNHYAVVQAMFRALHDNGYVTERSQLSAIDPATGRGLPDRYVEGTCPICGYDGARGDQCDNCGNQLDPQDLINPRSKIDGKPPQFVESAQFFLELPAFAEALGGWLQTRQDWRPNVLKFSSNLIEDLQAAGDQPRPRLGRADPAARAGRTGPTSGSTSGSTRSSATCRRSVEWARRTGDPDAWRPFWQGPEARATTSWARTTSSSTR